MQTTNDNHKTEEPAEDTGRIMSADVDPLSGLITLHIEVGEETKFCVGQKIHISPEQEHD